MPKENLKDRVDGNEIDLSMSSLETVPVKELAALPKVTNVDLSCNLISSLPDAFCTLIHIIKLDLSKNNLTELPTDFGFLDNLQHLDLLGNQLTTLPRSFCRLKKLKWLDLKDNQLEDGLKKNAGDCLDEMQCKKCATRILMYMTDLDAQLDVQMQNKMKKKKEEEAKEKEKSEKEMQKKRAQKKAEKERRRRELENKRTQELRAQGGDTSDDEISTEKENLKVNNNHKLGQQSEGRQGGKCLLFVFFSFLALVVALLVAVDFHCQANSKDNVCHSYWHPARNSVTTTLVSLRNTTIELYSKHIAPYFNK